MNTTIREQDDIASIIKNKLKLSKDIVVTDDTKFTDLTADSLDKVELIMELEQKYNCEIPDNVAEKFQTVGDVNRYISQLRAS